MWDAIIAGAGPAGAVAAHVLAGGGRKVLLVDEIDPGTPKIGEALPGAAVRLLRALGLPVPDRDGPHAAIGGNFSSWGFDDVVATDFICDPAGSGWRLDRLRFDVELRSAASNAGAAARSGLIANVERRGSHWRAELKDGTFETARWVMDATGRRAAIARRLGAQRERDTQLIALYAISEPSHFQINRIIIEAVPHGWWYAARLPSGAALAGFHTSRQHAKFLRADPGRWLRALKDTRHLSSMLGGMRFGSLLRPLDASGATLDCYRGDNWIACGDAALSFDPISGQGIFSALHTGMTAAQAIEDALNGLNEKLNEYSRQLQQIRRIYVERSRAVYRSETRWKEEPFWSTRGAELPVTSKVAVAQSVDASCSYQHIICA